MSARLHLTTDMLRNGTHLLITDIDNIYSRHVPLQGFLEEGYDVYHAFEMRYPVHIYNRFGFVICGGHQFLRSSPGSLRFMNLVMKHCSQSKCDDQVSYNHVFFNVLKMKWDRNDNPNHGGALRINSTDPENNNLLVESLTGRSTVTNHTVKVWDRDFAWRVSAFLFNCYVTTCCKRGGTLTYSSQIPLFSALCAKLKLAGAIPKYCPSQNNWLGMPTKLDAMLMEAEGKVQKKIAAFHLWDSFCHVGSHHV